MSMSARVHFIVGGLAGSVLPTLYMFSNEWNLLQQYPTGQYVDPTPGFWSGGPTPAPTYTVVERTALGVSAGAPPVALGAVFGFVAGGIGAVLAARLLSRRTDGQRQPNLGLVTAIVGGILGSAIASACVFVAALVLAG